MPKIVCLSDTHNCNEQIKVPDGDILIHAGDATIRGTQNEVEKFLVWFASTCRINTKFLSPEITIGCMKQIIILPDC